MTPEEKTLEKRKVAEASLKVMESIKELIQVGDGLPWQEKAEILEESSSELDDHSTLEEFLSWCNSFLSQE